MRIPTFGTGLENLSKACRADTSAAEAALNMLHIPDACPSASLRIKRRVLTGEGQALTLVRLKGSPRKGRAPA